MKKFFILVITTFVLSGLNCVSSQTDITNLSAGVITSQYSDSPANEGVNKLIDNSSTTKFLTFHASAWVLFKSPQPYVLSKYSLTSGNDAPERDPLNWKLEGSNNGVTFYTLDTKSNQDFSSRGQKREFTIQNNTAAYLYYRLSMTNNGGDILQLAELELFGNPGSMPTEPFADFSIDSYLVTGMPVSFSDASLNTSSRKWTFEGGNPATSTDLNPKVTYTLPGNYQVKLEVTKANVTVNKTVQIHVKDINDWSSFIYPTVNITTVNALNPGYTKYYNLAKMKGFNSIEDFVKNCCLVIAKELYYTVDEANEHNLRTINYKLNEGGALSYKAGGIPAIEIGFDMNYLNSFSQSHSDEVSADEIYGVLCHEICHGYQRSPLNAGGYAAGTEYFGFLEGTADLARLLTGGFNPKRYPRVGGQWTDGYNVTAFFYQWITNTKSATFLKDINRTAFTINPWSFNAAAMALLGKSGIELWNEYQAAIPTLSIENLNENRVTIALNADKSELAIQNLNVNDSVSIYDLKGKKVHSSVSKSTQHSVDITRFPKGVFVVFAGRNVNDKGIKFLK